MATINAAIQLQNGMLPAFRSINTAILTAVNSLETFQTASLKAADTSGSLVDKIKKMADVLGLALSIKDILGLSDQMASLKTRLDSINDGLHSTVELENRIFQTAQSTRSSNFTTAAAASISTVSLTSGMPMDGIGQMDAQSQKSSDVIKNRMSAAADVIYDKFSTLPMKFGALWMPIISDVICNSKPFLDFIDVLTNNWVIIEPLISGAAGAMAIYDIAVYGATWATQAWAQAQEVLSTLMKLNPIWLVAMAVVLLIALFYAVVAAVNKFTGTTYSATGIICGAFMAAITFIGNLFIVMGNLITDVVILLYNYFVNFAEFFANIFNDPVGSIVRLFAGMADTVLEIIRTIASAIDTVFGSHLADTVSGWQSSLKDKVTQLVGEAKIKIQRMDSVALHFDRFDYGASYEKGYKWGESLSNKLSENKNGLLNPTMPELINNKMDGLLNPMQATAANTGAIKDNMGATEEDLQYMRDLAEQEVINRFALTDLKIDMTNHNNINSEMDLDGVISYFGTALEETIAITAEGVN